MDLTDEAIDYYQVLGCAKESNVEQIMAEYKARALLLHPDKNNGQSDACDRFQQLQEAKQVLTDAEMRQKYDKWLNSGLSISFKKWLQLNRSGQMFHWVKSPVSKPMITDEKRAQTSPNHVVDESRQHRSSWKSDCRSDLIKKFRDYAI